MTAVISRNDAGEVDAIELFCGYGGAAQGIHAAGANLRFAANHDDLSIECYGVNFPDVNLVQADLSDAANPMVRNGGKMVPGRYVDPATLPRASFMWASPSCKFHSLANAKKLYERGPQGQFDLFGDGEVFDQEQYANSERSRVTMCCPLRYAARRRPEIVVVENVVEAAKWGPARDGSTFRWWLREWENIGYEHEVLFLNSMFFPPTPQSRDRMYVVFWRRGNTAPDLTFTPRAVCTSDRCQGAHVDAVQSWKNPTSSWPLPRWGKYRTQYIYRCPTCNAPVEPLAWPAYSALDFSDLGPMIGDRHLYGLPDLKPNSEARVMRGLEKFRAGPPIVIPTKAPEWGGPDRPVTAPMRTQTTQQENAMVVQAGVVPVRTHGTPRTVAGQFATHVAGNQGQALVVSDQTGNQPRHITEPVGTTTTSGPQGRIAFRIDNYGDATEAKYRAKSVAEPCGAQTTTHCQSIATLDRGLPFVATLRGGGSGERSVADPATTVSAGGRHHALTVPPAMFTKQNGGPADTAWHWLDDPLGAVTARDTTGLIVLPWIEQYRSMPAAITDQLATVMTHLRHALASIEPSDEPVTRDDYLRTRLRMLHPDRELRYVCGFGAGHILLGNQSQQTAGLGNAVSPPVADWITGQCLATLRGEVAA